jgi:hypothetical protein
MIPVALGIAGGVGLAQLLQGAVQNRQANKLVPEVPLIYKRLADEYRRRMRNAEVGMQYQNTLNKAKNLMATGSQAVNTGNPTAYNLAQRRVADMFNELLAGVQKSAQGYEDKAANMEDMYANQVFQRDTNRWANKATQAQQNTQAGMNNLAMLSTYLGKATLPENPAVAATRTPVGNYPVQGSSIPTPIPNTGGIATRPLTAGNIPLPNNGMAGYGLSSYIPVTPESDMPVAGNPIGYNPSMGGIANRPYDKYGLQSALRTIQTRPPKNQYMAGYGLSSYIPSY